jgi:Bifunctional DNA primase/polymerase, N-terminal/AAA domain/Primase C terminal 1 (PriCT-1)
MTEFLTAALSYQQRNLSVIPIQPAEKKPLIHWEQYQSGRATESEIKAWWAKWPDANIGIVTGAISELVVIDLDSAEAKEKLKELLHGYDLTAVPRSRTGKGWQLFFQHPKVTIPNRAGIIPGLDVRGDGGYVVAPPSIHPNGKEYRWEVPLNGHLPKLPVELFKLIQVPNHNEQGYRERFDTARALAGAPEGQRDTVLFQLACKLRNADVPQEIAETLVLESARNCNPPFSERGALDKVARVYQKYEPKQQQPAAKQAEIWPEFLTAKDILQAPKDPTRWILDGCLPVSGASVVVAKPKVGKSTTVVDLCLSIARGEPFLGRQTQQGAVAYLFLDGPLHEIADVFVAFGLRESDPIYLHAGSAPRHCIDWLLSTVKEKGVRLVVIDTLQKLLRFKDINDYAEVTNRMEPLLDAARQGKCHFMLIHHAGKFSIDDLDAAIGSTAIRGLCYTYLFLKRLHPGSERRIISSDQRGGKKFPETAIGFNRVTGRIEVQGTMEEVEIEEAIPKLFELLELQDVGLTETAICEKMKPIRAIIVSKAIRNAFKAGQLERTGKGRKGSPFTYQMAISLDLVPRDRVLGEGISGTECEKSEKSLENTKIIQFPENRESNGNRMELNPKTDTSGTEFEADQWEEFRR